MAALSNSIAPAQPTDGLISGQKPSVQRQRLHLLYLLSDLFHHAKYHDAGAVGFASLALTLHPYVLALLTAATTVPVPGNRSARDSQKIGQLLEIWTEHAFYGHQHLGTLRDAVKNAQNMSLGEHQEVNGTESSTAVLAGQYSSKDVPFIMPSTHGDPTMPYYDLPAGNLMAHIVTNSKTPINPRNVKPLQFMAGPAEEALSNVVRDLLRDAEAMYSGSDERFINEGIEIDVDEMGQRLDKDEVTGNFSTAEAYYGWSVGFCERMVRRKNGQGDERRSSRDRGRSESSSPRKRRQYSSSVSSGRNRGRRGDGDGPRVKPRSRSRSTSSQAEPRRPAFQRAEPPTGQPSFRHAQDKPAVHARPAFTRNHLSAAHLRPQQAHTPVDQIDNPFAQVMPPAPSAHAATHYAHNFPMGPNGMPVPPPPPFHQGPWPPPPPNMAYPFNGNQYHVGFPPPPPPPGLQPGWQPSMPPYGHTANIAPPPRYGHAVNMAPPPPPLPAGPGPAMQGQFGGYQGQYQGQHAGPNGRNVWRRGQEQNSRR